MQSVPNAAPEISLKSLTNGKSPERRFRSNVPPLERDYSRKKDKFYKLDQIAKSVLPRKSKAY